MNWVNQTESPTETRKRLHQHFRTVLSNATKERSKRISYVSTPNGREELEWVLFEREKMFTEVNNIRRSLSKEELPLSTVCRVEQLAVGHTDYVSKYSLYCMELVLDDSTLELQP